MTFVAMFSAGILMRSWIIWFRYRIGEDQLESMKNGANMKISWHLKHQYLIRPSVIGIAIFIQALMLFVGGSTACHACNAICS